MRKPVIAGNWKMHKTTQETYEFVEKLASEVKGTDAVDVIICPSFTCLDVAVRASQGSQVKIAAQNMHWENKGAFTGEISPGMLKDLGVSYCIVGHSERRQYFAETDETVNKKLKATFANGIMPILCVGETLEERENGNTFNIIERQIKVAMQGLSQFQVDKLIIAYEPVWAIGTGKTASANDAQEVIAKLREFVANDFGNESAAKVRIQYGGSVKPDNIKGLMEQRDIDGALVGGASLEVGSFLKLINY
ncbi:MAG: triose-phosphate isomerase [Desulfitibacter sp. BRH_c19]|nr:MAG: triose-phosphate isomerase [Desulfitibacter sp. BRH_c19]